MPRGPIDVYLGDSIFGGDPIQRGGSVQNNPDGSAHATHWGRYGEDDKGVRVSWDVDREGEVSGVHGTDQNDGSRL